MNRLVVHTMGSTGYARLNSNKDANNRSRSCGQGCESRPFMGEGRQVQVQGQGKKQLFRWHPCHIPRMALCSMPMSPTKLLHDGRQTKQKMSEISSPLQTTPQSSPLTLPPPSNISKEKWVQQRIQPAPEFVT